MKRRWKELIVSRLTLHEEIIKQVFKVQEGMSNGELDPHKILGNEVTLWKKL